MVYLNSIERLIDHCKTLSAPVFVLCLFQTLMNVRVLRVNMAALVMILPMLSHVTVLGGSVVILVQVCKRFFITFISKPCDSYSLFCTAKVIQKKRCRAEYDK